MFWQPLNLLINAIVVILIFSAIESRMHAGLVAGVSFLVFNLVNLWLYQRSQLATRSAGFYFHVGFLLLFVLPMLIGRLLNWGVAFDELSFGPLNGPQFHQWSTRYYNAMLLVVVLEQGYRFWQVRGTKKAT